MKDDSLSRHRTARLYRTVFVTFRFVGYHWWADAPEEQEWLRTRHRHEFHVRAQAPVQHDDRDLEFCFLKQRLQAWCEQYAKRERDEHAGTVPTIEPGVGTWSCERWCVELLDAFPSLNRVEVSEDGENGAVVVDLDG